MSASSKRQLAAPLTLKELQVATSPFPNSKDPGDDGLLTEVYKQYAESILPKLLKVHKNARESGVLPQSMTRANIVLILKLNKDPLDPGSYRLISLLQNYVKIFGKSPSSSLKQGNLHYCPL